MRREFPVTALDLRIPLALLGLSALLCVGGIAVVAQKHAPLWWALVVLPLVIVPMLVTIRRHRVSLDDDLLTIAAGLHTTRVRVADLDLDRAEVANLAENTALRPFWKTFGSTMPGYRAGHFRLRDRRRVFVLITARDRVLALPERRGRTLLLSLERPQALLDALRDVARRSSRR